MAHSLFLGMYTFSIKKKRVKNAEAVMNNDFLNAAYYGIKENKFEKGIVQDIIDLLELKAYKNEKKTHGAILDDYKINATKRVFDIMIDGGITGIRQFIIKDGGDKEVLSSKDIVGPKFFARFWFPSGSDTGYIFIQKYGGMSIKPIFDSLLKDLFGKHEYSLVGSKVSATTTKKRLELFLKKSALKEIAIVSKASSSSTAPPKVSTVEVRLKSINAIKNTKNRKDLDKDISASLKEHGFILEGKNYEVKGVYEYESDGVKEERTAVLDASDETFNVIPNIVIPSDCIDSNNYPIFEKLRTFVDAEIVQVKKESK
jgi:hypothetical protein